MLKTLKIANWMLAIVVLVSAEALFRPDLLFNPVAGHIWLEFREKSWGDQVSLTPKPFSLGEDHISITLKLRRAGFSRASKEDVWLPYLREEIETGREVYKRGEFAVPCSVKFFVIIEFDEQSKLNFAEGTIHEAGCW